VDDGELDKHIIQVAELRGQGTFKVEDLRWAINYRVGAMATPKAPRILERLEVLEKEGRVERAGRGSWRLKALEVGRE